MFLFMIEFDPISKPLSIIANDLPNKTYVHLVYKNDVREISIYLRRKDTELPGATVETVNGCALHAAAINKFEIAGFQSQRYTVLVVSDLPRAKSLNIARTTR